MRAASDKVFEVCVSKLIAHGHCSAESVLAHHKLLQGTISNSLYYKQATSLQYQTKTGILCTFELSSHLSITPNCNFLCHEHFYAVLKWTIS